MKMQKKKTTIQAAYGTRVISSPLLMTGFMLALLSLPSCREGEKEEADRATKIQEQVSAYREEINALTVKVNQLERELISLGIQTRPNAQRLVSVDTIAPQSFQNYFQVGATVEAVYSANISPEVSGHLKSFSVSKGELVSKGQLLARLSTEVVEQNMEEVRTSLSLAQTLYERQERLWSQQIGSEVQYLEAKNQVDALRGRLRTLESQLELSVLRSPVEGYVDETFMKEGELAMPGVPILRIVRLDDLYINADISEAHLPHVRQGEEVILRFPAYPGKESLERIHRVGHVINPENRTFRMQLRISNPGHRYKPNMMARISIPTERVEDAVVIPSILISYDNQGHYVFTAEERNGLMEARKTYIERGPDGEGQSLVRSGLQAGQLLIRQGHDRVASGDPIRIKTDKKDMAYGR